MYVNLLCAAILHSLLFLLLLISPFLPFSYSPCLPFFLLHSLLSPYCLYFSLQRSSSSSSFPFTLLYSPSCLLIPYPSPCRRLPPLLPFSFSPLLSLSSFPSIILPIVYPNPSLSYSILLPILLPVLLSPLLSLPFSPLLLSLSSLSSIILPYLILSYSTAS